MPGPIGDALQSGDQHRYRRQSHNARARMQSQLCAHKARLEVLFIRPYSPRVVAAVLLRGQAPLPACRLNVDFSMTTLEAFDVPQYCRARSGGDVDRGKIAKGAETRGYWVLARLQGDRIAVTRGDRCIACPAARRSSPAPTQTQPQPVWHDRTDRLAVSRDAT